MELLGTHGTTKSRGKKISKDGFHPGSRAGKAGSGVYFWAYDNPPPTVATKLAQNWYTWALNQSWYRNDTDSRGIVIFVSLKLHDEGFFDCGSIDFQESLYSIASEQKVKDASDVAALYDYLLTELERELKQEFYVIKLNLLVPNISSDVSKQTLLKLLYSNYPSYVVRKKYSEVIEITDIKSF